MFYKIIEVKENGEYKHIETNSQYVILSGLKFCTPEGENVGFKWFDKIDDALKYFKLEKISENQL